MAEDQRRRFEDEEGILWEVRPQEDFKWQFVAVEDGDGARRIVTPPPEHDDPAELSEEQLRNLLGSGIPTGGVTEPIPPEEA